MKTSTRIWLSISAILVAVGIGVIIVALAMNHWNLSTLGGQKTVTNSYELVEPFEYITINTDTTDVIFLPSEDNICRIECREHEKQLHKITIDDSTLSIKVKDERKWYEKVITFGFSSPQVKIYLPLQSYDRLNLTSDTGDVTIPNNFDFYRIDIRLSTGDISCSASVSDKLILETSTGDMTLKDLMADEISLTTSTGKRTVRNVTAESLTIKTSTGDTTLEKVNVKDLTFKSSTGDLTLTDTLVENKLNAKLDTGAVRFRDSDAGEIYIRTDTGNVSGTLLSEKIFYVKSDTGKIDVPKTVTGGRCDIESDTGSIRLKIK